MRKRTFFTTFALFALLFTSFSIQTAASFNDDIVGNDFEKHIRYLNQLEIMLGTGPGKFEPKKQVTRAEFAAFVARALDLPYVEDDSIQFSDVPVNYGGNLDVEIKRAAAAQLIEGYDGKFFPREKISRQSMATIIKRALDYKNVKVNELPPLPFTDEAQIADWAYEAVQVNVALNIINGNSDGSFAPNRATIREHAAKVIYQMLYAIEPFEEPIFTKDFAVVSLHADGTETKISDYKTADEAIQAAKASNNSNYHVKHRNRYIWIPPHDAATVTASGQPYVSIYEDEQLRREVTYVQTGSQLDFVSINGRAVKVNISGITGYVDVDKVTLNPGILNPVKSYYEVRSDGYIYHHVYLNGKSSGSYRYMKATPSMTAGTKYYNTDGKTFGNEVIYNYYNYLPTYTKTVYTAEQLNEYVASQRPSSPLKELGEAFKNVEQSHGVNALHLLALAIHESNWGESDIARDKKNLYGMRATDGDPYNNAITYETYEDSIRDVAERLKNTYISRLGWAYNGPQFGNKSVGFNMKYASDPYWGQKIAGHLMRIDNHFNNLDTNEENRYRVGVTLIDSALRVRSAPWGTELYKYPENRPGISMVIVDEEKASDGSTWYKIISDHPNYEYGYVYAYGLDNLGQYVLDITK